MADRLHLEPRHRRVLEALLREHLPDVEVWAYGSRVNGRSHDGSDLDLALRGPGLTKIPIGQLGDFRQALQESNIPFLVEACDWASLPERFHREIEREFVVLVGGEDDRCVGKPAKCLGDIADIVMGQSPSGDTVSDCNGLPLLNGPTEFGSNNPTPIQFTTDPRKHAQSGDILFCVRGSTGRMNWADQRYAIGRGIAAIRHKQESAMQPLVRAVIEAALPDLLAQATGSTFSNVSAYQLAAIPYPDIGKSEQRAIAHILGTLDDKIELNRRMNETLEAMAQAIFKDWFVDFGPVRAKMEGRAPYLPPEIWNLFPVALDNEDKPVGWFIGKVGDCFCLTMGQSPPGSTYNDERMGLPFFQGRTDFGFRYPKNRKFCTAPIRIAEKDDTLVSVRAPVGDINMAWEKCCAGRGIASLRHKSGSRSFTYYAAWAIKRKLSEYEHTGTVFGAINKSQFESLSHVEPDPKMVVLFERQVCSLDEHIRRNIAESRNLAQTRDTLLPKLMSGEVCLRTAEMSLGAEAVGARSTGAAP